MEARRVVLLVLDGVGIGALPDAAAYGDAGSDSLGNTARAVGGLRLPNLAALGLGNIAPLQGVPPTARAGGAFGKMAERSRGKDTVVGHWEIAGVYSGAPQPTYPNGFPPAVLEPFAATIGRPVLGNRPASGTTIIAELGDEHVRTGWPIVYTSADSVFQVAAHTDVVPLAELYRWCEVARGLLRGEHAVGRVIARPFNGSAGAYNRTADRRDWALLPPTPTILDHVRAAGLTVATVGKIADIFSGRGVTTSRAAHNNTEAVAGTLEYLATMDGGLLFVNLIEGDMIYGHRRDPQGYAAALAAFDAAVPALLAALRPADVLMIVGDHGVDPTRPGTDHTREYVPVLVTGPAVRSPVDLGVRATFADAGQTVAELLGAAPMAMGTSFAREVLAEAERAT